MDPKLLLPNAHRSRSTVRSRSVALLWGVIGIALLAPRLALAACDCQDVDGDGYPDNNAACTGSSVSQTTPFSHGVDGVGASTIVVQFSQTLACGMYANGDPWVVEPSPGAGVTISSTSPEVGQSGGTWRNGYMIDPVRYDHGDEPGEGTSPVSMGHSFDGRSANFIAHGQNGHFSASSPMPVTVQAGSTFVKAFSRQASCSQQTTSQTCVNDYMPVTVLAAADRPGDPVNTFRPPFTGKWRRGIGYDADWVKPGTGGVPPYRWDDVELAWLPGLDHSNARTKSGYIASVSDIRDQYKQMNYAILSPHNHKRRVHAMSFCCDGPIAYGNGGDYAPRWAGTLARSWLRLTESGFDPTGNATHRLAMINLLQQGIDWLHAVKDGDTTCVADGGHYAGCFIGPLLTYHLWKKSDTVGYSPNAEYDWLSRNKQEGAAPDVGFPSFGEQSFVYRNPNGVDQSAMCGALPQVMGKTCEELGIDPGQSKVLYGQRWGARGYTDAQKTLGGKNDCLGDWTGSVSTHCRDPYGWIDHPGNACRPDPDQQTSNYERIIQPHLREVALAARLYGAFRADGSGPFPNHIWDFAARRYWLGYETQPDNSPSGGNPTGYAGANGNRCADLHHAHACAGTKNCYPESPEYPPVCWYCRALLDEYPAFVHQPEIAPPPPPVSLAPPILLP